MTLEEILARLDEIEKAIRSQTAYSNEGIIGPRSERKNFWLHSATNFLVDAHKNIELAVMVAKEDTNG